MKQSRCKQTHGTDHVYVNRIVSSVSQLKLMLNLWMTNRNTLVKNCKYYLLSHYFIMGKQNTKKKPMSHYVHL